MAADYRIVRIPKKHGGHRTIYIPDRDTKAVLRHLAGRLATKADRLAGDHVHGFTRRRSPVSNALAHIGHRFTLSFDLADFFDTVTPDKLGGKLSKEELVQVVVNGAARQGLPTSPAVSNLAFAATDAAILKWIGKQGKNNVIYTRYADDLAFSYDDPALGTRLRQTIPQIVSRGGWRINSAKTELHDAHWGRRRICGVMVDDHGICASRAFRRRLRAAEHRLSRMLAAGMDPAAIKRQAGIVSGMRGWAAMKPPDPQRDLKRRAGEDAESLRRTWRLRRVPKAQGDWSRLHARKVIAGNGDENLADGVVVSAEPCQILGMSTFTTGWTSCMAFPSGQFRLGVTFWVLLAGTSLAYLPSRNPDGSVKTMTIAGVTRPRMRARALVHALRDGRRIYDRCYGDPASVGILVAALKTAGYRPASEARGALVVGTVPDGVRRPYFDSLGAQRVKSSNGSTAFRCCVR